MGKRKGMPTTTTTKKNKIAEKFEELASRGECALVCYVVAGYPDIKTSQEVIDTLIAGGADIIEIGIPFSDPIADGPTIQAASGYALEKGITPEKALQLARAVRKKHPGLPLLAMTPDCWAASSHDRLSYEPATGALRLAVAIRRSASRRRGCR
jgi:hypothetical protein